MKQTTIPSRPLAALLLILGLCALLGTTAVGSYKLEPVLETDKPGTFNRWLSQRWPGSTDLPFVHFQMTTSSESLDSRHARITQVVRFYDDDGTIIRTRSTHFNRYTGVVKDGAISPRGFAASRSGEVLFERTDTGTIVYDHRGKRLFVNHEGTMLDDLGGLLLRDMRIFPAAGDWLTYPVDTSRVPDGTFQLLDTRGRVLREVSPNTRIAVMGKGRAGPEASSQNLVWSGHSQDILVVDSVGNDAWMPTAGPVPLNFSSDRAWAAAVRANTVYITDMTKRLTSATPLDPTWADSGAGVRLIALSPDGSTVALYGETKVGYDYLEVLGRHGERLFPARHVELGMYVNWFFTTGLQVVFVGNFRVSIIELDGDVQHFRTPAAPGAWLRWPYFVLTYGDTGRAFRFISQPE